MIVAWLTARHILYMLFRLTYVFPYISVSFTEYAYSSSFTLHLSSVHKSQSSYVIATSPLPY